MSRSVYLYRPGHPHANERGFVDANLVGYEDHDLRVYIASDRYYENQVAPDGTDIGSAKKHRAWVKENGLVYHGDNSPAFRERQQKQRTQERRESIRAAALEAVKKLRRY